MTEHIYTQDELTNRVTEDLAKYYKLPDLTNRVRAYNWDNAETHSHRNSYSHVTVYMMGEYETSLDNSYISYTDKLVTTTNYDRFFEKFINELSNRVGKSLSEVLARIYPKSSSRNESLIFCNGEKWRDDLLTSPLLLGFYDLDVKYNDKKTYAIATYTDKYNGKQFTGYYQLTKTGLKIATHDNFEFETIKNGRIRKIKLYVTDDPADKVKLDNAIAELYVPMNGYSQQEGILSHHKVLEHTDEKLVVDYYRMEAGKQYLGKLHVTYTVSLFSSGKAFVEERIIEEPSWMDTIIHERDMIKNPLNKSIYEYLGPNEEPIYEGTHVFVTSDSDFYVQPLPGVWIIVEYRWLKSHVVTLPEGINKDLQRYLLLKKLTA